MVPAMLLGVDVNTRSSDNSIEIAVCNYNFSAQLNWNLSICGWEKVVEYSISGTCFTNFILLAQPTTDLVVNMLENTNCIANITATNVCMESKSITATLTCPGKFLN